MKDIIEIDIKIYITKMNIRQIISDFYESLWFYRKIKIENFIDEYIFHTKRCPEHGYECHGRCEIFKVKYYNDIIIVNYRKI